MLLCCLGPHKLITLESGLFPVPNEAAVNIPWASVIVYKMKAEEILDKYKPAATGTNVELMGSGHYSKPDVHASGHLFNNE